MSLMLLIISNSGPATPSVPSSPVPYDDNIYPSVEVAESSDPNSYDSDVQDWIDRVYEAGGTITIAKKAKVQTIVTALKSYGRWAKIKELHLPGFTTSFIGSNQKIKYVTAPSVTLHHIFSGDHTSQGYIIGNGRYIDTGYNASDLSLQNAQGGVILTPLSNYGSGEDFLFGMAEGDNRFCVAYSTGPFALRGFCGNYNTNSPFVTNNTQVGTDRFFGICSLSSVRFDLVSEGVHTQQALSRTGAMPAGNIYIGGVNQDGTLAAPIYTAGYSAWFMASGLTESEYDAVVSLLRTETLVTYTATPLPTNLRFTSFDPTDQLLRVYEGADIGALAEVSTSYLNAPSGKSQRDWSVIKYNGWYWAVTSNVDLGGFYTGSPNFALAKSLNGRDWVFVSLITTSAIPTALTFAPEWFIQDGNLDVIFSYSESAVVADFRPYYIRFSHLSDTPVYGAKVAITGTAISGLADGGIDYYMFKKRGTYYLYYSNLDGYITTNCFVSDSPYSGFDFDTGAIRECSIGDTPCEAPQVKIRNRTIYMLYDNYVDTGMKMRYSVDNGATWSAETHLSNGGNTIRHGCLTIDY